MRGIFSLDGSFYKYGSILADIMILSLLWIFFSIPLITIGASTTALFYVTTRRISGREGYLSRDFWHGFKTNFKRATIIWLLMIIVISLIIFNFFNFNLIGGMVNIFIALWIVVLFEVLLISIYIFPLTARFDMTVKELIRNAFFMGNRHMLTSITCIILGIGVVMFCIVYMNFLIIFSMGIYAWVASYMIMRVFKKYRPEMDKDPEEEIAEAEAEKNKRNR